MSGWIAWANRAITEQTERIQDAPTKEHAVQSVPAAEPTKLWTPGTEPTPALTAPAPAPAAARSVRPQRRMGLVRMAALAVAAVAAIASAVAIAGPALNDTTAANAVTPTTVFAEAVPEAPAPAAAAPAASAPAPAPKPAAAAAVGIQTVKQGFSQLPREADGDSDVVYALLLRNPAKDRVALDVRAVITLTGRNGAVRKVTDEELDALLPGQLGAIGDNTEASGVTGMRVQVQVGRWVAAQGLAGSLRASGIRTGRVANELTTTAMLRSTLTSFTDADAVAIWYDRAGRIIGGHTEGVDDIPAGGAAAVRIDTSNTPRGIARTEVYGNPKDLFDIDD